MDGRSQRITGPLSPRARRIAVAAGALIVVAFGGAGVWGATHADRYGRSRDGCVTVSVASSTGGALLHDCGAAARALCRTAFADHGKLALLTREQCRLAGLGVRRAHAHDP
jgi:hypothetical protein